MGIMILYEETPQIVRRMTVSIYSQVVDVRHIGFRKNKYGPQLLVDVAWISEMPSFAKTVEPYTLDFYDITLVTGGKGSFWLDDKVYDVVAGQVLFTTPGQVRRWYVKDLQGICLFFPASFILEHFQDPLFLNKLRYFHTLHGPEALQLSSDQSTVLIDRLLAMHKDIAVLQEDSHDLLRAISCEVLILLNRWYSLHYGFAQTMNIHHLIVRFRELLEKYYTRYHKVAEYAALLSVTPGHLNVLCKSSIGRKANELISERLFSEAARRLIHSDVDIETLSERLGFNNSSYFCRAFKREKGTTPLQYRKYGVS